MKSVSAGTLMMINSYLMRSWLDIISWDENLLSLGNVGDVTIVHQRGILNTMKVVDII